MKISITIPDDRGSQQQILHALEDRAFAIKGRGPECDFAEAAALVSVAKQIRLQIIRSALNGRGNPTHAGDNLACPRAGVEQA
jgi:hypothetical protein